MKLDDEPENVIDNYDSLVKEDYEVQTLDSSLETGAKKFIKEFTVDDTSKLAQASETEPQGESHIYHCFECNIHFASIEDHVTNCHVDQEVVFQVSQKQYIYRNYFCTYEFSFNWKFIFR